MRYFGHFFSLDGKHFSGQPNDGLDSNTGRLNDKQMCAEYNKYKTEIETTVKQTVMK